MGAAGPERPPATPAIAPTPEIPPALPDDSVHFLLLAGLHSQNLLRLDALTICKVFNEFRHQGLCLWIGETLGLYLDVS